MVIIRRIVPPDYIHFCGPIASVGIGALVPRVVDIAGFGIDRPSRIECQLTGDITAEWMT